MFWRIRIFNAAAYKVQEYWFMELLSTLVSYCSYTMLAPCLCHEPFDWKMQMVFKTFPIIVGVD